MTFYRLEFWVGIVVLSSNGEWADDVKDGVSEEVIWVERLPSGVFDFHD